MATKCYDNRELSWLKFNQRVLEEAKDEKNPLCERLSFLSIFQSNLDEFFMVRCGSLHDQMCENPNFRENKTNMTCKEQLTAIYARVRELLRDKDDTYEDLRAELSMQGVDIVDFHTITTEEAAWLEAYFKSEIEPLLSPQIIGKKQPFPFLQNKYIYAVVVLEKKGTEKLGIVPCSSGVFPKIVSLPTGKNRFILSEELILHFAPDIFSRHTIKSKSLIRIIRNADIEPDERTEEEEDYREAMEQLIRERRKLCPIKMEFSRLMDTKVIQTLCGYLNLSEEQVFYSEAPLNLSVLSVVRDMLRHNKCLFYNRRVPQEPAWRDSSKRVMEQVEEQDRFLTFPYESIRPFLTLLNEAGHDPDVVSIKMTLYRVASNSKIVEALIDAAENGKDVVVLVELRARFDEENNIEWSRRLEDAGCRIIYGLDNLKVHSKLCLITKKIGSEISYITQVGTGNYNEKTSAIYTDYSLMTANHNIGLEASRVFNALCLGQTVEHMEHLLVAPKCLQNKLAEMIDEQTALAKMGQPAYIGIKINSLTDKYLIEKLIEASKAGVKIEMIIRGISCLIAGVPGETENVSIRSIVGRFLEHTRIYIFGARKDCKVYIASADWMTRNTRRRVEVAAPIYDNGIKQRILDMFDVMMTDNVKARVQQPDGTYTREPASEPLVNSQEYFYAQAYEALAQKDAPVASETDSAAKN
ncbi:polyphosphate kinase 1 [uncultured Ruminococcus sp.]|uniref:polyphosphate kinase 1 n=1 Tax=uncultured Ruminococcus sp. TaxID=165186 RepID=UPI00265AAA55|nr:polyphosphate kinase 1 [uncultured Ruminococcus sp.]